MTTEREVMTLEQVLRVCRRYVMDQWERDRDDHHYSLVDRIDAQIALLSRAAEPVAWWNGKHESPLGDLVPSVRWGKDAEDTYHDIPLFAGFNPVHTHPSADARDRSGAWIIEHDSWYHGSVTVRRIDGDGLSFHVLSDGEAQSLCALLNDAAMAKENGNG